MDLPPLISILYANSFFTKWQIFQMFYDMCEETIRLFVKYQKKWIISFYCMYASNIYLIYLLETRSEIYNVIKHIIQQKFEFE